MSATDLLVKARLGIDSYKEWLANEKIPVAEGLAVDLFAFETGDWPRYGVKGGATHLDGRGDFCNMFVIDIPPAKATTPQRHLYEEVVYVLQGRGSTQLEFTDGTKRSFEWGPRSLFAIPLNAKHRHFNASGSERALLASTTNFPIIMKMFRNDRFIFDLDFEFDERIGREEYYAGDGDLVNVRQGNNYWETNFVPDLGTIPLTEWGDRGAGGTNIMFVLADGTMHAHISEMKAGTYKKAHRHPAGTHVMAVTGTGFSLLWHEGQPYERIDWKPGTVFPPANQQLHQHFTTSNEPARYLGTALGSIRYPVTEAMMRASVGAKPGEKQAASRSIKEGGDQVEYEDQDPRIHAIWLEEMRKHGITPQMEKYIKA